MTTVVVPVAVLAAEPTVNLGTTAGFAVLGGSTVTNTGSSITTGDAGGNVGLSPGTSVTGFPPGAVYNGTIHIADGPAAQAQIDLVTAYNDAAGRTPTMDLTGVDLGGLTLKPGVYSFSSSAQLTGALTLDAEGDPDGVFIFQIGTTLTTASNSSVNLINKARYCRTFWQVGSSATLGTGSHFTGHIFAMASITANTGATVQGQLLARTGAVTLDTNTITNGVCATLPASVSVTKTLAPGQPSHVRVGDQVSYVIGVTNSGATTLTTVPLADEYDANHLEFVSASPSPDDVSEPGVLAWDSLSDSLAPGKTTTVTVSFRAKVLGTSVTDTATVEGAENEAGLPAPPAWATANTLAVTNPHLIVAKGLAPGEPPFVPVGGLVTYDIIVGNDGDTTMTTVPLADAFDSAHLAFVSATPSPDSVAAGQLGWDDITGSGSLAPGASATVAVTFRATAASGSVADTATVAKAVDVNGDVAEETSATDVTVGTYVPSSLSVTKTANPVGGTILAPGQTITYRLGYANSSPATMPAAALVDHLPSSVTYQTGSLVLNGVPISDMGNYTPGTRTIDVALGSVGPGVSGTLTFRVTVGPWAASRAGIRNAGLWTSGGSVVATTQPVYHYVDSLDITKSVANMSGKVVRTGSVLKWTIVITNRGIVPATHVVASDKIPLNTTYVKGSVTGLGSDVSQLPTLVWHVGTIGVGKSVTLTFKSTINSNVNNGVTIWNRAWSRADQSPTKGSTTVGGAVNDSTTVVVQTTGDENATIGLVAVLAALATGFMWVGRPGSGFIAKRGSRITAAVLVGAALVTGGMEVGAALGLPLPSPGEAMVSAAQATPAAAAAGRTVNGYAVSGRVILPTVHIDQRLVEGASAHALTAGLWHQPPSLKPGSAGTCVIAGHRISSQFSRLSGVKIGDRVWVASGGVSYKYRVTYVGTLRADGPTLGFRTGASERLILYTCIPRWAGDKRTVVVCNRTSK